MITTEDFKAIMAGDVFYRGGTRYAVESIQHRDDVSLGYPIARAIARTNVKQSVVRRGQIVIQTGIVTFMGLDRFQVHKIVKANKVRGIRAYKSRKNYPFVQTRDRSELERSESNDCTVRSLATFQDKPYDEVHAYLASKGRRFGHGFVSGPAYAGAGLTYKNTIGLTKYTLGSLVKSGILPTRAIVRTKGHVLAVINGTVHDSGKIGSNSKVYGWYYVNA